MSSRKKGYKLTNFDNHSGSSSPGKDWLDSIVRGAKYAHDQLPKSALETHSQDKEFILKWFKVTNWAKKLELAYSYGLVSLDDNQRFIVRNSMSRDYEDMRLQLLATIYWRDGSFCAYCSLGISMGQGEVDHVIPRSAWPKEWLWLADDSSNLVAACKSCNAKKSNFYKDFWGENRLHHITFECKAPRAEYECCLERRRTLGNPVCQDCDDYIPTCCTVHEEVLMPVCEVTVLKPWFGHE